MTSAATRSGTATPQAGGSPAGTVEASHDTYRETVESVVIAVILAFLFRGFVAEAFVIPTGSMAPTLMGRHIDIDCPQCGLRYMTNASSEDRAVEQARNFGGSRPKRVILVNRTLCPQCGYRHELARSESGRGDEDPYNGDRIIVGKFSYDIGAPERWNVIVFKFPGNAKINYIKRLVGLPNELVVLRYGDVFTSPVLFTTTLEHQEALEQGVVPERLREEFKAAGHPLTDPVTATDSPLALATATGERAWLRRIVGADGGFLIAEHDAQLYVYHDELRIARKPSRKLLAMLQLVNDSQYVGAPLVEAGWPLRWQPWTGRGLEAATDSWASSDQGRTYQVAASPDEQWLRYRHLQASADDWEQAAQGSEVAPSAGYLGDVITDYYAYNYDDAPMSSYSHPIGDHWVPDLALECEVEVQGSDGEVCLELVRAGRHHRCRFDVAEGTAELSIDDGAALFVDEQGQEAARPQATSGLRGKGAYRLRMTNVDEEMRVWVGGRELEFDGPTTYRPADRDIPSSTPQDAGDLLPAGVGCRNVGLAVNRLRLLRDIYYIATDTHPFTDYEGTTPLMPDDPNSWTAQRFDSRRQLAFVMGSGQYFPLGDNSPSSQDARLWHDAPGARPRPAHYVTQELLIGKALVVYWPHPWRRPIPLFPDFSRMGRIR